MNRPTWFLVTGVFVIGWLLIPAIILHYRLTSVVHRYNEVLEAFLWRGVPKNQNIRDPLEDIDRIPAWHYMKALRPLEATDMRKEPASYADLLGPIQEQYRILHGPKRCIRVGNAIYAWGGGIWQVLADGKSNWRTQKKASSALQR
jgi:hypothetical protein